MIALITDRDAWPFFALAGAMLLVALPMLVLVAWSHYGPSARTRRALDRLYLAIECDAQTTTLRDCRPRPLPTARTVRA